MLNRNFFYILFNVDNVYATIIFIRSFLVKIFVTAKPKAKQPYVRQIDKDHFIVVVKEPPVDDKANRAVIQALAHHFKIEAYQIRLVSGQTGRKKILELL